MVKLMAVVPLEAAKTTADGPQNLSFMNTFGMLGLPILFVTFVSMLWTIWLICLNVAPNATANYLMGTGDFDNGNFWLILGPDLVLLAFTTLCLSLILVLYGIVILRMTLRRNPIRRENTFCCCTIYRGRTGVFLGSQNLLKVKRIWQDITGFNGRWRKHWNSILKVFDLALQLLTLHRILEYGFAPTLCFGYATLVAVNALSCAAFIFSRTNHSALVEVLVDTVFDMFFAVGAPSMLLVYAYSHFDFDRARARLILEVMNPGDFDRQARLMADPRQVSNFLFSFDALRTITWGGLVTQAAINISFCYRLLRVVEVYSASRRKTHLSAGNTLKKAGNDSSHTSSPTAALVPFTSKPQARVPRVLALAFFVVAVVTIVHTYEAIAHSRRECRLFPECGAFAYRWSAQSTCPCLAYINVDEAPKTFYEWMNPKDVTASVAALAASGDLLVFNIINRRLRVWPDELRRCKNLQYISLMYTGLQEIPSWAAEFTKLQFLSIEGKAQEKNLVKMPVNLFDNMSVLANVHLGIHFHLKQLPRLERLQNLNSITFAGLTELVEIPSLSSLKNLQRFEVVELVSLKQIPLLPDGVNLATLSIMLSLPCCNGFLGQCDLTLPACDGMNPALCLPSNYQSEVLNENTQRQIATHNSSICFLDRMFRGVSKKQLFIGSTRAQVDKCQGKMYRECIFDTNRTMTVGHSICINDRFQVVSCIYSGEAVTLRRREISENIGSPCDPEVEAWLGCQSGP